MTVLIAAVCILSALVLFNLLLSFGLVRRMRLSSEGAEVTSGPPAGARISPFSARALDGVSISERDLVAGPLIVGFFQTGCQPCVAVKEQLIAGGAREPLVVFVQGDPDDPASHALAQQLATVARWVAVVEHDSPPTRAFAVAAYPTLIRLDGGVVQAAGYRLRDIGLEEPARQAA